MKNRFLNALLVFMIIGSCSVETANMEVLPPQDVFTFIAIHTKARICNLPAGTCIEDKGGGMASGVLIHKNKESDVAHILTAEHVCVPHMGAMPSFLSVDDLHNELAAVTNDGEEHKAKIIAVDERYDLCLLQIEYVDLPVVTLAKEQPKNEEHVFNLAAPQGIWSPGATMILEGRYDGEVGKNALYTLPAAPGSSGSPIFNDKGELVGILHSVARDFPMAAFASRLVDVRRFLSNELVLS